MKSIFYGLAVLVACGAAFFSFNLSNKFAALEADRAATITKNKETTARAKTADEEIVKEKALLTAAQEKRDLLTQSIDALKATGTGLTNDLAKLNDDLNNQDAEFASLNKALEEINSTLQGLDGVTLDTLGEKIQQIEADKIAKQAKLEELETLSVAAQKNLETSNTEIDRLGKRRAERDSRIARNAMESVVTAVNQDWGFVVIGAGSNSGFTPQTALLVERNGRTIGRVTPSSIEPTQTIAEIDLKSLAAGVRLQPGDRVVLANPLTN